jgi:hypothetical protein
MQGYSNGSLGPSITEHYHGYVEASMQGNSEGSSGSNIGPL